MTANSPVLPGATLGVLGGGQLGRMFALAAYQLGYKVAAYTDQADSPVSQVCPDVYVGAYDDEAALKEFGQKCAAVTIEFENIPVAALQALEKATIVRPGAAVLHITQNRLREKTFLSEKKYPLAQFVAVNSLDELKAGLRTLGLPAVLKTAGFGYDGKGQTLIRNMDAAAGAFTALNGAPAVLEKFVEFECEISVIGARSQSGDFVAYGPIENAHKNHILDLSLVPARVSWTLGEEAIDLTRSIMDALNVVGLLCVEFFVTAEDTLLINELAPRPHNSGHYSIEACPTSQFEQQVRCLAGLPLGSTENECGAAMVQLIGDLWAHGEPDWGSAVSIPDVHLHLYGKHEARAGRKMGHITALARWADEAVNRATNARDLLSKTKANNDHQ